VLPFVAAKWIMDLLMSCFCCKLSEYLVPEPIAASTSLDPLLQLKL